MDRLDYLGHKDCVLLTDGDVEDCGRTVRPRIPHYGFVGGGNLFGLFPDVLFETELGRWRAVGGNRLWVAPEANPHSYAPDEDSLEVRFEGDLNARFTADVDAAGIEKSISVGLMPKGSDVRCDIES